MVDKSTNHSSNQSIDPLDQQLRRTLHTHLDLLTTKQIAPMPSVEAHAILARMRTQTMLKLPLRFSGAAVAILFLLLILFTIPQLIPERNLIEPSQTPAPGQTSAVGQSPTASKNKQIAPGRVLYRAPANGGTDLFLTDENGANPVNLTNQGDAITSFTWSPDGEWIAYSRSVNQQENIFVMDTSGKQVTQLTNAPGMLWRELAWSSHGKWIAATGALVDHPKDTWLYLIPLKGGEPQKLFTWTGIRSPAWSPAESDYLLFSNPGQPNNGELMIHAITQMNSVVFEFPLPINGKEQPGRVGSYSWSSQGTLAYIDQDLAQKDGTFTGNARAKISLLALDDLKGSTTTPKVLVDNLPAGKVRSLSWSPDEKVLAFTISGDQLDCLSLNLVDVAQAGRIVKIPDFCLSSSSAPAWTADGRLLVLDQKENRSLQMVVLSVSKILDDPGSDHFLTQSIDRAAQDLKIQPWGKSLALKPKPASSLRVSLQPSRIDQAKGTLLFSIGASWTDSGNAGQYQIYSSHPDGNSENLLKEISPNGSNGSLSPDGLHTAFISSERDTKTLFITDIDSLSEPQQWVLKQAANPVWSPDGKHLALQTGGNQEQGIFDQIVQLNMISGQPHLRTISLSGIMNPQTIAWSPDGSKIALAISATSSSSHWPYLYVLDLQNSLENRASLTPLTQSLDGGVIDLAWSPDGRQIAYLSHDEDYRTTELRLVNADGSGNHTLARPTYLNPRSMGETHLAWSPDGHYLSFITYEEAESIALETHITLADTQSGKTCVLPKYSDEQIIGTAWSPDSRWIAYKSDQGVFVTNVVGTLPGQFSPVRINDRTSVDILVWRP